MSSLKNIITGWLALVKGYSVHSELGLLRGGQLRADLWGIKTQKGQPVTVLVELKSGFKDFNSDTKFHKYRPYATQCYVAMDLSKLNDKQRDVVFKVCKAHDFGVLDVYVENVPSITKKSVRANVSVLQRCGKQEVDQAELFDILKRVTYRNGLHSGNVRSKLQGD